MKEYDFVFVSPLPPLIHSPAGGIDVFYRLSSYLSSNGYKVAIINVKSRYRVPERFIKSSDDIDVIRNYPSLPKFAEPLAVMAIQLFSSNNYILRLFQKVIGNDYDYSALEDVDVLFSNEERKPKIKTRRIFATAWQTAYFVEDYLKDNPKTHGFYLIQNFEDDKLFSWNYSSYAKRTYSFKNLKKIVVSRGLYDRFKKDKPFFMPVGINLDLFKLKEDPNRRNPFVILMPLREDESKGSRYALETAEMLIGQSKNYKFLAYGTLDRELVPSYIEYYYNPTKQDLSNLYNRASIFICPSVIEGFGLPPLEAMASGCASVITDSIGIRTYAKTHWNSIVVPVKDSVAISDAVKLLIKNPSLKKKIVLNGMKTAKRFSYDSMYKSFISASE